MREAAAEVAQPLRIRAPEPPSAPPSVYSRGDVVFYTTGAGEQVVAQIVAVHEDTTPPNYTILAEGSEQQTDGSKLAPLDVFDSAPAAPAPTTSQPPPPPVQASSAPSVLGGGGGMREPSPGTMPTLPTRPSRQSLPPEAMAQVRGTKKGGFFEQMFGGGGRQSDIQAGLDTSLPKHLEPQGNEIARLGQYVRQLAGAGQYAEALQAAQQRLGLTEQCYGQEHILTATCLNDVATFVQAYGRFDEAEQLFERASKLQRKLLGDVHPHSIATLTESRVALRGEGRRLKEGGDGVSGQIAPTRG